MSKSERESLANILSVTSSRARRWKLAAGNAFVLLAASLLAFVLVWSAVAWIVRRAIGRDYGWESPLAIWILLLGVLACSVISIVSTSRWVRSWPDSRRELAVDLKDGVVVHEFYRFVAVKRFQEPEHGGLIYFFCTDDERVLVLYDLESQNLGAGGEDPLSSPFRPRTELMMVRAPATKFVLDKHFNGSLMDLGAPIELAIPPKEWPEQDEFCAIPWDELEKRLGLQASSRNKG